MSGVIDLSGSIAGCASIEQIGDRNDPFAVKFDIDPTAPKPPARRRNAAATREAILNSARHAFANAGYDRVGVREIARGAGVTAMLVNRYFGSKEQLFAEVLAQRTDARAC